MKIDRQALLQKFARFLAGFAGYEAYVRLRRAEHPNLPVMTYEEFIEREAPGPIPKSS